MSSILDSLKKSQLQRGEPPPVHKRWRFSSSGTDFATGRRWLAVVLAAVLISALFWFLGFQWERPTQGAQQKAAVSQAKTAAAKDRKPQQRSGRQAALVPPDPDQVRQALRQHQSTSTDVPQKSPAAADKKQQAQAQRLPAPSRIRDLPVSTQNAFQKEKEASTVREAPKTPARRDHPPATSLDGTAKAPPTSSSQTHRLLHQLPFSLRQKLPKLVLSVHVWDKNPDYRLVVINGEDLGIGDTLENSSIRVKDILPAGALLEVGADVFLLPRQH